MSTTDAQNVNLIFTASTGRPHVIYVKKNVPDRDNLITIIQVCCIFCYAEDSPREDSEFMFIPNKRTTVV